MFWGFDLSPEEEEKLVKEIAEKMYNYGVDVPALLVFETMKPFSNLSSQLGRFALSPFLPLLGDDLGFAGEKWLQIFEKEENVEKIIKHLEELSDKDNKDKSENKEVKKEKKAGDVLFPFKLIRPFFIVDWLNYY